jgi:hypothetical protein
VNIGKGVMNPNIIQKLNLPLFFLTSFSCYQGALHGMPWLGLVVFAFLVALFLPYTLLKKERLLVTLLVAGIGFAIDSALIMSNVYMVKESARWLLPAPLCPEWILVLWLNFGFMLYIFWGFLAKSRMTPIIVGIIFSFLIFGNASRMGLVVLRPPQLAGFLIIAACWAVLIPFFTKCAVRYFGGQHAGK